MDHQVEEFTFRKEEVLVGLKFGLWDP